MKILVTGATGYIGSRLTHQALKRGYDVIVASRQKSPFFLGPWMPYDLSSDESVTLPAGTDIVVHLAAITTSLNVLREECEVVAAQRLIKSSQEVGARFIFVSSQTAQPEAPTSYGRIKWHIEQEVLSAGGWVVRPGQVYGGKLCGLFGMLVNTVRHLPILPAFLPAPKAQPIHVDDLAEGLLRIAERLDVPSGVYCLATTEPVSFSIFLGEIAQSRLRCWRGFFPVPIVVINSIALALGYSLRTRLGLERLSSLFNLPVMETKSDLNRLGLELRPLRSGMHRSGNDRRRCLLREGRALLSYVLKEQPCSTVLRRYVRLIEELRSGRKLGLPHSITSYPVLLSLIDESVWPNKLRGQEFIWRLDAATVLAEATPSGAYRFLGLGRKHGVFHNMLLMIFAVTCELFWRILRVLFLSLIRLSLRRTKEAL